MEIRQIITPKGSIQSTEPNIPKKVLVKMFETMILLRLLDEKGMRLQRQGRIAFNIPSTGQEATQIGAVAALNSDDWVVPAYREPGIALYRGYPLEKLIDHWFCNRDDPQKGRRLPGLFGDRDNYFFVNPSAPIGTQVIHAAGIGYAQKYLKDNRISIVFFGDGATSSNDFHSGLNFGGVFKTPTIFFCQNNQWAISVPLAQQTAAAALSEKARGYGIPGVRVDGNDVLAVYSAVSEAAKRARSGEGPTFIEGVTYRIGPHTSSDDPTRYRPKEELERWEKQEPISRFYKYLFDKGLVKRDAEKGIREKYDTILNDLIKEAESKEIPDIGSLFTDVYADQPWHLQEQYEELASIKRRKD
ncbi:MAG: thiamine pyrophosphate-dependent dehydrogenase E1 component subunit alpha [Candidatus Heimdallarchaeota archaeon]